MTLTRYDCSVGEIDMEKALLTAALLAIPTIALVIGFKLVGRKVEWVPLLWAGFACLVYFLPRVGFRDAGLVWTQDEGSLRPVIQTGGLVILFMTCVSFLFAYSPNTSIENLLWQATMPGIDEELFFRGLLLLLLHQAFGKGLNIWWAETGWGFWLVTVTFGLLHGVTIEGGDIDVDVTIAMGTGFMGFILTWMRERTGSLVVPVLFHNVSNVAGAFV